MCGTFFWVPQIGFFGIINGNFFMNLYFMNEGIGLNTNIFDTNIINLAKLK